MATFEYVGILDASDEPVFLSELCSQIEGGELDGLVLFDTIEEAQEIMGGFDDRGPGGRFCRIKLVVEELEVSGDGN